MRGLAGKYSSVVLANHGPVVAGLAAPKLVERGGRNPGAAVFATEELEETAKLYLCCAT